VATGHGSKEGTRSQAVMAHGRDAVMQIRLVQSIPYNRAIVKPGLGTSGDAKKGEWLKNVLTYLFIDVYCNHWPEFTAPE